MRRPPTQAAVVGGGAVVLGLLLGVRSLDDNSFLTHLATGRLILEGDFPTSDPYTYVAGGVDWVVQSWLASVVFAAVESVAGGSGLLVLFGALNAALAALVWILAEPARSLVGRVLLVGPTLVVGAVAWTERPLLFGLVGLCVTLAVCTGRWSPVVLAPVLYLWAQTHGSWPIGVVVLALHLVGSWADEREISARNKAIARWAGVGIVTMPVSPLGLAVWTFPVELLSREEVLRYISEWRHATWQPGWQRAFLLLAALGVVAVARRPRWRDGLWVAFSVGLALLAIRNLTVASLIMAAAAARGMATFDVLKLEGSARRLTTPVAAALAGLAVVVAVTAVNGPTYRFRGYPIVLMAWAEDRGSGPLDARWAHEMRVGNLLEAMDERYHGVVYIDDRVDMFPTDHVERFVRLGDGRRGWDETLDRDEVDVVLWTDGGALPELLRTSDSWRVAAGDGSWILAVRRTPSRAGS